MDLGGIALRPRPHGGDDGQPALPRQGDEVDLGGEGVDGIDDEVIAMAVEELDHVLILEEVLDDLQLDLRVDVPEALGEHAGLRLADAAMRGDELAVDIGGLYRVGIDDGEATDAATYEELAGVAADAPQPHDEDMAGSELTHTLIPEQQSRALRPGFGLTHRGT